MMTSPHEGLKRKGWDISGEALYCHLDIQLAEDVFDKHLLDYYLF
jgi:hypothetical protein